jgi:hypothetical protein
MPSNATRFSFARGSAPPNKAYLDSSRQAEIVDRLDLPLFWMGVATGFGLQTHLRPLCGARRLRAMMESRARGANR